MTVDELLAGIQAVLGHVAGIRNELAENGHTLPPRVTKTLQCRLNDYEMVLGQAEARLTRAIGRRNIAERARQRRIKHLRELRELLDDKPAADTGRRRPKVTKSYENMAWQFTLADADGEPVIYRYPNEQECQQQRQQLLERQPELSEDCGQCEPAWVEKSCNCTGSACNC